MAEQQQVESVSVELDAQEQEVVNTNPQGLTGEETEEIQETSQAEDELPPLTFIDFLPQCLGTSIEGKEPQYADFGSVVEQANQWLSSMPQFSVYKCETIDTKLGHDYKIDADNTLTHRSSSGRNILLRGLRLWLIPRTESNQPVQQLAYVTVLPDHSSGNLKQFLDSLAGSFVSNSMGDIEMPNFDVLGDTVKKLNAHLQVKPLPGKILTVETLTFKAQESNTSDKLNTEACCWAESGANSKLYLYALRIFYVLGQPAYETIGIHDEEPEIFQNMEGIGIKIKFSSFSSVTAKAAEWIRQQQNIRVVNIQTLNMKLERKFGNGPWVLKTDAPGFSTSHSIIESRYTKVLRIMYIKDQKLDTPTPYSSTTLTSRLFIPQKIEGKLFETFSKTMLRAIKWLNATRLPVFACESVTYKINADSYEGPGFSEERMDAVTSSITGQYYLTCIRLYFPSEYQEPPEEIETKVEEGWGYSCVIS